MLAPFVSIVVIGSSLWSLWKTARAYRRSRAPQGWWIALAVIFILGGLVGFWLGQLELRVSLKLRWAGWPLPIAIFQLEDGQWNDFVPERPVQWLNCLADTLLPVLILNSCLRLVWRKKGGGSRNQSSKVEASETPGR